MQEIVLITGANGMVAQQLAITLQNNYSIRFFTRNPKNENEYKWDIEKNYIDINALKNVSHIIHLAGVSIVEKRWTKKQKQCIIDSRVKSSKLILKKLKKNNIFIKSFISASAVGYYGTKTTEKIFKEEDKNGKDFLAKVCKMWEKYANKFLDKKISDRVLKVRIGLVLSKKGGALKKMVTPVRYFIGSALGSGKQYMPWIHINDLCNMISFLLKNENQNGVFNAVVPEYITNQQFIKTLAKQLKKPLILPNIPNFILKIIFGKMSDLVLKGSRVSSDKIIKAGFNFEYENLQLALEEILDK